MPERGRLTDPAANAAEVTPSDADWLEPATRALYVGAAGDVRVTMLNGQVVDFTGVDTGEHPWQVKKVHATGTTATGIVALW